MMLTAVWLQTGDVSAGYVMWLTIFVGILAVALLLQAIATMVLFGKLVGIVKDMKQSFDDTKGKALPLIADIQEIATSTQVILHDLTPKIKVISENVVETSHTVRQTVEKLDVTIRQTADRAVVTFDDANARAQKQVARVDGMVATTLAATSEIGQTVYHGIRVPARKIAEITIQSKHMIDTLIDRLKALTGGIGQVVQGKTETKRKPGW
ncbi:hypothetical protein [Granulicella sibirica]|uniref:DUF948 domain-containing protein n=1 Tax=Granulicella sibirica TaxID=2479048 RepID=A0A4V1L5Z1_9BACT|nr:hypothetical protein [Granulicella sibirica]RXH57444.1 hypothetical protein GRAN_0754 [Granulicella sibirica]